MTNKVSIIVPCYNHAKYLEECIESIKNQSYSNWECIIVDDGSTDDTQSVSRKLENEKIRYVYQENRGLSGARNTGIRNATGDYILPLDADDTLNPLALEKMIAVFTQKPETLIVFSDTVTFGHTHKKSNLQEKFTLKELLLGNKMYCTSMFAKKYFDEGIIYDEKLRHGFEDWEFWIQLISTHRDQPIIKIDYPVFNYRSHPDTSMIKEITGNQDKIEFIYHTVYEKHKTLFHEFFPSYITLLNRKTFYEQKLEKIYGSKPYRIYNFLINLFR
ncbi:glycosyltransferase family 2 protein [Chryseobacterium sp. 22458]|uniref:glycosyltransferase family 2 protein n=1 Tax=Chryseobacterium sp. 22458 TaxID=3453921 RepID=UPI003F86A1B2